MAQENRAEIRERRRKQRAAERKSARQAARQAKAGAGLFTGIGARMQQRQTARQGRKSDRITARSERIQSRSEGGFYDPESVAARYGAASSIASTIGAATSGGGWSEIAGDALGALTGDEDAEIIEFPTTASTADSAIPWLLIAGAGVAAYFLLAPKKKKKR